MFTSELEYYRQRAREERERAATSSNPIVAEVHRALAEKYEAVASQPEISLSLSRLWRSRTSSSGSCETNTTAAKPIARPKPSQNQLSNAAPKVAAAMPAPISARWLPFRFSPGVSGI